MQLTKHFAWDEISCRCCQTVRVIPRLFDHMERLQKLREEVGPIRVTSGYRCLVHNQRVGGAPDSQHRWIATDIQPLNVPLAQVYELVQSEDLFGLGGIGRYDDFLHLDLRGEMARW